MKCLDKLTVTYHDRKVGTLSMTPHGGLCAFAYEEAWLADGFSISPLELPLQKGLFIAKRTPFYGNFGIFEDSLPDGYGRYLLHKILQQQGIDDALLSPIARLSIVGSAGMGALCYVPETFVGENTSLPTLDRLQQLALDVLSQQHAGDEHILYFNSGNSGGCRPKCLWKDNEGEWLVKFRHTYDPMNMGEMEYRHNMAARACGIHTLDFKLLEGKYFASKRFDVRDGIRLHVATAGALLNESIESPKLDYKTLLHLTGFLTQEPQAVEQMFRRMAFNVYSGNKDDHPKNFSFLYDRGRWHLAPAYDLTKSTTLHGEHATSVNFKGLPTAEDMLIVGESIRIPRSRGKQIIEQVSSVCAEL